MTTAQRNQIIENLKDKESRDFFVEEFINTSIPFQIRAIRKSLSKTQGDLAKELDTGQSRVSQLENPDYGNLSLNTLKKLASIFDVALIVKFAPFSDLVDMFEGLSPEKIAVATYSADVRLHSLPIWGSTDSSNYGVITSTQSTFYFDIEPPARPPVQHFVQEVNTYERIAEAGIIKGESQSIAA